MRTEKINDTEYEDLFKVYDFNPKGKQFEFYFTKDTCHKKASGICALEIFTEDMRMDFYEYCRNKKTNQCIRAYLALKSNITIGSDPV